MTLIRCLGLVLALCALPVAALADAQTAIREQLHNSRPDLEVTLVQESEIPGIYHVQFKDGPMVYATADGRYLFVGDAYETDANAGLVNVLERRMQGPRAQAMAEVDLATTIRYAPKGEARAVIYVFTDVDCGYCQRLHQEMAQLNGYGIEVRYLAYPRAGQDSETYRNMVSAWCARDPQRAMNRLKARQSIPQNVCADNPVMDQYHLARALGVQGTPAIIAEDGYMIPGYMPAEQLAKVLGVTTPAR